MLDFESFDDDSLLMIHSIAMASTSGSLNIEVCPPVPTRRYLKLKAMRREDRQCQMQQMAGAI